MIRRYELSDAQWQRIVHLLPGKAGDPGRHAADNRLFVHGVLWILRRGARWSDLPARYGKYKTGIAGSDVGRIMACGRRCLRR